MGASLQPGSKARKQRTFRESAVIAAAAVQQQHHLCDGMVMPLLVISVESEAAANHCQLQRQGFPAFQRACKCSFIMSTLLHIIFYKYNGRYPAAAVAYADDMRQTQWSAG